MLLLFPVTKFRNQSPREDVPYHAHVPGRPSRSVLCARHRRGATHGAPVPHQGEAHLQVLRRGGAAAAGGRRGGEHADC